VTLAEVEGARVWGRCFEISEDAVPDVYPYLLEREKQYDLETDLTCYAPCLETGEERVVVPRAKTWIATPDRQKNPNYLGPLPLDQLSQQIATSRGPSGPNSEYLFMLCEAMREYGLEDDELFELERQVQARLGQ